MGNHIFFLEILKVYQYIKGSYMNVYANAERDLFTFA